MLGGSGRDPETLEPNKNVTYAWTVVSPADPSTVVDIDDPSAKNAAVTIRKDAAFSCPATNPGLLGDYTLRLTVTDRNGASTSATHTVQVTNAAPTGVSAGQDATVEHFYNAGAGDYRASVSPSGQASASDNGDPTCRTWHMGGNTGDDCAVGSGSVFLASQSSGVPSTLELAGPSSMVNNTHKICVKEVDAWGLASCDCALVSVTNRAPPVPTVAVTGSPVGTCGNYTVTLTATKSGDDLDGDPVALSISGDHPSGCTAAGTQSCAQGVNPCVLSFDLSCTVTKTYTFTARASDGLSGGTSVPSSSVSANAMCQAFCGGDCG
jgi:hypothetical protein